jgi:fatty acid desaturase
VAGEAIAGRYQALNCALLAGMIALTLGALIALPMLLPRDPHWGWLLLPVALLTNGFWALHHEAIHNGFHTDRRLNQWAGRLMAVLLGSSFFVLRFGHLMHHRYNRNPIDRPDTYDPAVMAPWRAHVSFLINLTGGLYLVEVLVPLACLLPRPLIRRIVDKVYAGDDPALRAIHQAATRLFLDPRKLNVIRVDALLSAALIAVAATLYGAHWPMLLAFLLARGALISIFDNVYHYATPIDRPDYARNLWLPAPIRLLILNMNLHRVHHARTALAWWELPGELASTGDRFDAKLFPQALAQFAGPVPVSALVSAPPLGYDPDRIDLGRGEAELDFEPGDQARSR